MSTGFLRRLAENLAGRLADLEDTEIALVADAMPIELDRPTVVLADDPLPPGVGYARLTDTDDGLLEAAARLVAAGFQVVPTRVPGGVRLPVESDDLHLVAAFHRAGSRSGAAAAVGYSRSHFNRRIREVCDRLGVERPIDAVLVLDRLGVLP
jgi:hypothetical protein